MAHRTDTRQQTIFLHQGVTLDFAEPRNLKITLAAGTCRWFFPSHWHLLHQGCHAITNVKGRLLLSSSTPYGGSGSEKSGPGSRSAIRGGDVHSWSSYEPDQEFIALLESEDEVLYRNAVSAILDADRFPFLSTTPLWFRILYYSLAFSPAAQRALNNKALWIQLQTMYCTHDMGVQYGSFPAPFIYWITHPFRFLEKPPTWVFNVQWWSVFAITKTVQRSCYWFSRLFLGMEAEYVEYTPHSLD
jgi:hypothetical protein